MSNRGKNGRGLWEDMPTIQVVGWLLLALALLASSLAIAYDRLLSSEPASLGAIFIGLGPFGLIAISLSVLVVVKLCRKK
jgi:hypothetical protein